jgi:hypothetical protein
MSTLPAAPRLRPRLPLAALLACALALAAGAVALTAGGDTRPAPRPAAPGPAATASGAPRLETSFGSISVDSVVRLTGSRRPMGVPVGAGELPVQVAVTVTNLGERPLRVPRSMVVLEGARASAIDPGRRTDFRVPALSAHRFVLRSAVADGVLLPDLVVRDPAGDGTLRVALGRTDDLVSLNVATHTFGDSAR